MSEAKSADLVGGLSEYPYEDIYGYSRLVRVGNQVFVSGTTARGVALRGDAYVQACAAFDLIADALAKVGAEFCHVVRTVVYLRTLDDLILVARAHRERFEHIRPASTIVETSGLVPVDALLEIEVTAIIGERAEYFYHVAKP